MIPARALILARSGALFYIAWGAFHCKVAWDIAQLGAAQDGLSQGRLYQLAAYMFSIALFVLVVAVRRNWRNDSVGYTLNLAVAGWADGVWLLVVVAPGYVPLLRGLAPPALFVAAAILTTIAKPSRASKAGGMDSPEVR